VLKKNRILPDALITLAAMAAAFLISLTIMYLFTSLTLIPMIFVLAVFITSLRTEGYLWGIIASIAGVFAVNYAFTDPYFELDFLLPESFFSAVVMLIVAFATSTLITKNNEQKRLTAEGEREKMRANLLRAVSHDIRTPLTSIYGSASALIDNYETLKPEQHLKLLGDIRDDSQWLIRMVENLLSVTRIGSDKIRVIKTPTVLDELIDSAIAGFQKHFPSYAVQVELPDEFISIPMDPILIEQVIINLLENAVYHGGEITELILSVKKRNNRAYISISDNGSGIPKEKLSALFKGYTGNVTSQADMKRSNMGIGLFVCSTIVKAHGGDITAENRPEGGARFTFWLETENENE